MRRDERDAWVDATDLLHVPAHALAGLYGVRDDRHSGGVVVC